MKFSEAEIIDNPQFELAEENSWIEFFPYGVSVGPLASRPVLVLRDQEQKLTLPVWLNETNTRMVLAAADAVAAEESPYILIDRVFAGLDLKLDSCVFVDLVGHHQFVELVFSGSANLPSLRQRADQVMAYCLRAKTRFFSTHEFVEQCRSMNLDLSTIEPGLLIEEPVAKSGQKYLM